MVEVQARREDIFTIERSEGDTSRNVDTSLGVDSLTPFTNAPDQSSNSGSVLSRFELTQGLTFKIVLENKPFWSLKNRELLIKAVKEYAKKQGIDPLRISSEAITRTWRFMVQYGFIDKDPFSDLMEHEYNKIFGVK